MKIYWIKIHVKQTIKKEYQKKSLKILVFQWIFRSIFSIYFLLLLLWLAMCFSLLAIACRLARTHAAWIRERCWELREESCSKQQAVTKTHDRIIRGLPLNQQMARYIEHNSLLPSAITLSMSICFCFQDLIGMCTYILKPDLFIYGWTAKIGLEKRTQTRNLCVCVCVFTNLNISVDGSGEACKQSIWHE